MLQTSARLLRLLSLLQARRFWSGNDLAERLEVTERTVRRDVDRLRTLGYPVNATSGVAGGYQLGAGASLPPLLLEDDEALAVALGLRTAAAGTVTGMEEAAVRALAKLEQVLPSRLRRRIKALHASFVPMHLAGPRVDPEILMALSSAFRDHQRVHFRYSDGRGETSDRTVEPHGLVHAGSRWYCAAWDVDRGDWRTFRVDRIAGKVSTGPRFSPREIPGSDLAAYVSRSVSSEAYTYRARVILNASIEVMTERLSPTTGRLERFDSERCLLETGAHSLYSLTMHIALLEVDFEVLEPAELRDSVRTLAKRLSRAAEQPGATSRSRKRAAPSRAP